MNDHVHFNDLTTLYKSDNPSPVLVKRSSTILVPLRLPLVLLVLQFLSLIFNWPVKTLDFSLVAYFWIVLIGVISSRALS